MFFEILQTIVLSTILRKEKHMSEAEIIGAVVIALGALLGLYWTVCRPMLENQKTMVELTCVMRELKDKLVSLETDNANSHKRIWDTVDKHTNTISDHETRLKVLEKED